jgi:hypothetical protein
MNPFLQAQPFILIEILVLERAVGLVEGFV